MSGPERPWWVKPGGAPPPPGAPPRGVARPGPPPRPAARQPAPPRPEAPRPGPPPPRATQQAARPNPYGPAPQHRDAARQAPPRRGHKAPTRGQIVTIAVAAVVVAAAFGAGLWMRGDTSGPRLDVRQAEAGVAEILSDPVHGYGANDVAAVACNNGKNPRIEVGAAFMCAVDINGTVRQVVVEFIDDDGTYAVDGPR